MSYKIAIASGKGGTGKTTVAVSLFHYLSKRTGDLIHLVDCDVEEPNDIIFFNQPQCIGEQEVLQPIPVIDPGACNYCRKCVEYCAFNAIVVIPTAGFAEVNSSLCHSCGACLAACDKNAISEKSKLIGHIRQFDLSSGNMLTEGRLKVGSAMQTMLIRELKKQITRNHDIILYDAPPGTSCPVVETISDVDYVILVAEPTPFGVHDLKLMYELLYEVRKPFGVLINKANLGNDEIYRFLRNSETELLGELPFIEEYAGLYSQGELFRNVPYEIENCYGKLVEALDKKITVYEGNNHTEW
jgi:MinD superfamily P-loop ATPase